MDQDPPAKTQPEPRSGRRTRKRTHGWGLAIANQLALPGLGTVLAGRKIGYLQMFFSLSGFALTTAFIIWAIPNLNDWLSPPADDAQVLANFEKWKPWFAVAFGGVALFVIGWCMALFSSQSIVNRSQSEQPNQ